MFKNTIKKAVMGVIKESIEREQVFYDSECKAIDEKLEEEKKALEDRAETNKKLMVTVIVKKIASQFTD